VSAREQWRAQLEAWAIPPAIVAAAPESPYGFPAAPFVSRGGRAATADPTATTHRALEALAEGGTVLDVGCGGGATSLPLAGRAGVVVGVDAQEDMLEGFVANARAAGVEAVPVQGRWPDVVDRVPHADVAVAGHVLYNVPDLEPFVRALAEVVRRRIVFELTDRHPLHWMNDLWVTFHGLERPDGPTADDAVAAIAEIDDLEPHIERGAIPPGPGGFAARSDAIALVRRRLCLDRSRDDEIERALGERLRQRDGGWNVGPSGPQPIATIRIDQPDSSADDRDV
jgi:SAM-dependent methyltransferase